MTNTWLSPGLDITRRFVIDKRRIAERIGTTISLDSADTLAEAKAKAVKYWYRTADFFIVIYDRETRQDVWSSAGPLA